MSGDVLSRRALGRATMARQLLLGRSSIDALGAVDHLVGMQAQEPLDPYLGLWSRLEGFEPAQLGDLLVDRRVVRIPVMRATVHLVTAGDCLLLRPLTQPVLDAELARHPQHRPALAGVDTSPILEDARAALTERPMTMAALRAHLAPRFAEVDAAAAAYACRNLLALVQVPPRGVWGRRGQVTLTTAEAWLGHPLATAPSIDDVAVRYLRAYGPALPADLAAWSRLTGMREVLERLRPRLRTWRDERGRELFDVPDGALPDPDTPAPPRLLPTYDNAVLSHGDRLRYTRDDHALLATTEAVHGSVLDDASIVGTWSKRRDGGISVLTVRHLPLPPSRLDAVAGEAHAALRFLEPGTDGDVRLVAVAADR